MNSKRGKVQDAKRHFASVNDIAFSPLVSGAFVTGDNDGHVIMWDARSRKRVIELPTCPNSVASLSYNHVGQLLAVASSYTYQEANEMQQEDLPSEVRLLKNLQRQELLSQG
ncbi:hypothetical protein RIF29_16261 [Crotalaria pallida]|uniref:Uncharacterized protein n=1 Tax=Crotalaria pallida TaxID=3830 RepID=A0AAN9IDE1_CROPI